MAKRIARILAAAALSVAFLAASAAPAAAECGDTWECVEGAGGESATNITWEE
ncbi:MAG TPA: hypothetical protein VFM93_10375 [Candidatus Limnocylindria bacterium]|nr:hypothetical protein [Candidatus Limnocylindria bacterium]